MLRVWSGLLWLGVGLSAAIQEAEPGQFPYTVSLQVRQFNGQIDDKSFMSTEQNVRVGIALQLDSKDDEVNSLV